MRSSSAATVGFLVAPLVAAVATAGFSPITGQDFVAKLGMVPLFYAYALAAGGLLGFPAFLALRHFRLVSWWTALVAGAAVGAIVAVLLVSPASVTLSNFLFLVPTGAASGLCFWAFWRLGNVASEERGLR